MYKLLPLDILTNQPSKFVQRLSDNAFIPFDPANMDFVEYNKWLEEGNQPEPADEVV